MPDETPDGVWVVPTEMGRRDVAFEIFAILMAALAVYWWWSVPALRAFTIWPAIPILALLAVWILTGEGAADLPFVGAIAGPLRARFGQRRAHEWVVVYAHYLRVGPWPRLMHASHVRSVATRRFIRRKVLAAWRRFGSIRVRTLR